MMHGSRSEKKYSNEQQTGKQKQLNYTCTRNLINFLSKLLHVIIQLFSAANLLSGLAILAFLAEHK